MTFTKLFLTFKQIQNLNSIYRVQDLVINFNYICILWKQIYVSHFFGLNSCKNLIYFVTTDENTNVRVWVVFIKYTTKISFFFILQKKKKMEKKKFFLGCSNFPDLRLTRKKNQQNTSSTFQCFIAYQILII